MLYMKKVCVIFEMDFCENIKLGISNNIWILSIEKYLLNHKYSTCSFLNSKIYNLQLIILWIILFTEINYLVPID